MPHTELLGHEGCLGGREKNERRDQHHERRLSRFPFIQASDFFCAILPFLHHKTYKMLALFKTESMI